MFKITSFIGLLLFKYQTMSNFLVYNLINPLAPEFPFKF